LLVVLAIIRLLCSEWGALAGHCANAQ